MTERGIRIEGLRKRYGEGDTAVDASHVGIVDFFPVVARTMIVGVVKCDSQRVSRHALTRKRGVITTREIRIAVALMFIDVNSRQLPR